MKIEYAAYDYEPFPVVCGLYSNESDAHTELLRQQKQSTWRQLGYDKDETKDPKTDYHIVMVEENTSIDLWTLCGITQAG